MHEYTQPHAALYIAPPKRKEFLRGFGNFSDAIEKAYVDRDFPGHFQDLEKAIDNPARKIGIGDELEKIFEYQVIFDFELAKSVAVGDILAAKSFYATNGAANDLLKLVHLEDIHLAVFIKIYETPTRIKLFLTPLVDEELESYFQFNQSL
ncbi:hypothetical protein ACS126_03340 [Sphingobacterium lactis]|uniref:hypothetical protein n=1 Tax=Sphingobacterium TaxID=28453 RepID=UPI000ED54046|nr:hypothetical protein [Sphingobacterium hotanense]MCT1525813.1 hypothetical protein [Sphingobacterium hotanense]HAP96589.1 hypothetical protein [Chryseobacterium sp.]